MSAAALGCATASLAAVAILGAYLRWAVGPVTAACRLGMTIGRLR